MVGNACSEAKTYSDWSKLLYEYCGGLSDTSKMPGFSWSIPAELCSVGSKLARQENTTCSDCYALKGRYVMPNVKLAMARRYVTFMQACEVEYSTFCIVLTWFLKWNLENPIKGIDSRHFRWFDSGDVQSLPMLYRIVEIALNVPEVQFWLPSRELMILHRLDVKPKNLIIRYSTPIVDTLSKHVNSTMVASSGLTVLNNCQVCPATTSHDRTCNGHNCRACWNTGHVAYVKH